MRIQIKPISAFNDNYIWIIIYNNNACVIDPGQKEPVLLFLQENKLNLQQILITHHHADHTGGVLALVDETGAKVYGPKGSGIKGIHHYVQEGDIINPPFIPIAFHVLNVPGHTLDHVAYIAMAENYPTMIFCGDTLFSCGSGRLFEGNSRQMLQSLDKFKKMSENSLLFCAHEYTLSNIKWAQVVDPDNQVLQQWKQEAEALRNQGLPTLPTTLARELNVNPFLRVEQREIKRAAEHYKGHPLSSPEAVLAALREWKNSF
ncbi:hydroxyacylglutathione hydrolase [Pelistega ratti]|uniref:hydroxyacylglutathione hydrolase n=1 Tax=Pelistega ratti TaxID=2652177 RepID=UPI00135BBE73|nr:hydroxyacylglutathione hydrolase [Pelistega ratti]